MRHRLGAAMLAALALAACNARFDLSPTGRVSPAENPVVQASMRQVQRVDRIELGRTFDGVVLSAYGEAADPGWTLARLRPRGTGPSPDGFLEFELVAVPPGLSADGAPPDTPQLRRVRGDALIDLETLSQATGVRVIAAENAVTGRL